MKPNSNLTPKILPTVLEGVVQVREGMGMRGGAGERRHGDEGIGGKVIWRGGYSVQNEGVGTGKDGVGSVEGVAGMDMKVVDPW